MRILYGFIIGFVVATIIGYFYTKNTSSYSPVTVCYTKAGEYEIKKIIYKVPMGSKVRWIEYDGKNILLEWR